MKQCPTCNRTYADESLTYCLADGSLLSAPYDPEATQRIPPARITNSPTEVLPSNLLPSKEIRPNKNPLPIYIIIALLALIVGGGIVELLRSGTRDTSTAESSASKPSSVPNISSTPLVSPSKRNSEAEAKPTPTTVPSSLTGNWEGTYSCAQGLTNLNLSISQTNSSEISAVFKFSANRSNPSVPSGSYRMIGTYDNKTNKITLRATDWINQPSGYVTVDLVGKVSQGNTKMSGDVLDSRCTTFTLEKK